MVVLRSDWGAGAVFVRGGALRSWCGVGCSGCGCDADMVRIRCGYNVDAVRLQAVAVGCRCVCGAGSVRVWCDYVAVQRGTPSVLASSTVAVIDCFDLNLEHAPIK